MRSISGCSPSQDALHLSWQEREGPLIFECGFYVCPGHALPVCTSGRCYLIAECCVSLPKKNQKHAERQKRKRQVGRTHSLPALPFTI